MNKLLIILLAVCLVSVHAFVKREAETTKPDALKELGDSVLKQIQDAFDPENIKKGLNDIVDTVQGVLKPNKPEEAKA